MADQVGIQVQGARELRRTLAKAGQDLNDLTDAHKEGGQIVAAEGKQRAPRVTGARAGTVRSSGTKTGAVVRAGTAALPGVPPDHWGWAARNIAPNPWLSEALEDKTPQVVELYEAAVDRVLQTIKGA
jgi:hypothetical protein